MSNEAPDAGYGIAEQPEAALAREEGADAEGLVDGYMGDLDVTNVQEETGKKVLTIVTSDN